MSGFSWGKKIKKGRFVVAMVKVIYSFTIYVFEPVLRPSSLIDFHKHKVSADHKVHKNDFVSFFLVGSWRNAICPGQMVFTWVKTTEYASWLTFH